MHGLFRGHAIRFDGTLRYNVASIIDCLLLHDYRDFSTRSKSFRCILFAEDQRIYYEQVRIIHFHQLSTIHVEMVNALKAQRSLLI